MPSSFLCDYFISLHNDFERLSAVRGKQFFYPDF